MTGRSNIFQQFAKKCKYSLNCWRYTELQVEIQIILCDLVKKYLLHISDRVSQGDANLRVILNDFGSYIKHHELPGKNSRGRIQKTIMRLFEVFLITFTAYTFYQDGYLSQAWNLFITYQDSKKETLNLLTKIRVLKQY